MSSNSGSGSGSNIQKVLSPKKSQGSVRGRISTNRETLDRLESGRIVATIQKVENGKYGQRDMICAEKGHEIGDVITIHLHRGGHVKIYPNVMTSKICQDVKAELLSPDHCGMFRRYQIQANDEPRAHFLLHEDATQDFNIPQPGYRYANVTLKARPLYFMNMVHYISDYMKEKCKVEKWTIGVNPVIYRDGRDKISAHADNDQGEQRIVTVIVDGPTPIRRVCIKPNPKLEAAENDEDIELFLRPGDAYEMDGEMQQHYVHSVPPEKDQDVDTRLVVVLRVGTQTVFEKDSGRPCTDLTPEAKLCYSFGHCGLTEGHVYSRTELRRRGAFLAQQRGVSGSIQFGCDAIVVSGLRPDGLGDDDFTTLMYAVEAWNGGQCVLNSFRQNAPIRIFRSTTNPDIYGALVEEKYNKKSMYRYDGLYKVERYELQKAIRGPLKFYLRRCDDGSNHIGNFVFYKHCVELKTIRGTKLAAPDIKWSPSGKQRKAATENQRRDVTRNQQMVRGAKLLMHFHNHELSNNETTRGPQSRRPCTRSRPWTRRRPIGQKKRFRRPVSEVVGKQGRVLATRQTATFKKERQHFQPLFLNSDAVAVARHQNHNNHRQLIYRESLLKPAVASIYLHGSPGCDKLQSTNDAGSVGLSSAAGAGGGHVWGSEAIAIHETAAAAEATFTRPEMIIDPFTWNIFQFY